MIKTISLIVLFIVAGVFIGLNISSVKKNKVETIQLISNVDFVINENGGLYARRDTVLLCFFEDFTIYREKYPYEKYNKNALDGDTVVISDDPTTIDVREMRFDYFIWRNNAKEGMKYSGDGDKAKMINVDSIKAKKLFKNAQFYNIAFDKLLEKNFLDDKNSFQEKYVSVSKPDNSYCDTTYYIFSSRYSAIPYSLSPLADSVKKSKLIEVRYIYNPVPKGIDNRIDIPKREMVFKIEKVQLDKPDDFQAIIQKFKRDNRN